MEKIVGVTTKENTKGEVTHVTINVKKHKDKIQALTEIGLMPKTPFMERWEKGLSIEEARAHTLAFIKTLPWKK